MLGPWWPRAAQFADHFGEREPFGDFQTLLQTAAQLRSRDVQDGHVVLIRDFVGWLVLGAFLHIDHVSEVDHFDAHFFLVLAEQILGVVGAIKVFAGRVFTGACMITAHDEMCASVIFAD